MSSNYPILRHALRPEYAEATDDVIETVVAELYGDGVSADDAEEFLGGIGKAFGDFGKGVAKVASQAAPVLGNALPGVLSGAATGAALGPWGALAGAAVGGVTSAISASGKKPRGGGARRGSSRGAGGALGSIMGAAGPALQALGGAGGTAGAIGRIAGMAAPAVQSFARGDSRGGVAQLVGAAGQAASGMQGGVGGQIAGLLARPEVQQALTSQLLGPFGRNQVSVGGTPVPTTAVMNMLGSLFNQAATESIGRFGEDEAMPVYLMTGEGEYAVDPANPDARAAWLAQLIADTPRPVFARHAPQRGEYDERHDDEASAFDPYEYDEYDEFDESGDERVAVTYSLDELDEYDEYDEYDEHVEWQSPAYGHGASRALSL